MRNYIKNQFEKLVSKNLAFTTLFLVYVAFYLNFSANLMTDVTKNFIKAIIFTFICFIEIGRSVVY
jgi:hypothetical protein